MKTLVVTCLVLTVSVFGKESVSDLVSLLEDPDILQEIVKRLGHDDPVKKSDTDSAIDDSCQHKNFSNTIIQTKASTAAGAAFLDSVNGLLSNQDCIKRCCELDGCELAVYENKGDRNCYLFRCKDPDTNKNYCEFASLDGYISSSITHDVKAEKIFQSASNSDHENDLQDLSESGKLVKGPITTTTTTTTTTTEKPEEPHSVSIGGVCQTTGGCEDSHSFCLNGICTCRTSYYNKHGTCREVCGHSRFECKVVDLDGPDCIRNSLVCDGRNDCHDGSDEQNCQTDEDDKKFKPDKTKIHPHHSDIHEKGPKKPPTPVKNVKEIDSATHKESPSDTQQHVSEEDTVETPDEGTKSTEVKDKSIQEESNPDTSKSNPDTSKSNQEESNPEGSKSNPDESKQSTDSSESKEDQTIDTPENTDTGSNKETGMTIEETESLIVSKERLTVDSSIQTAQGPIIALSLGLAFTFLLLVFIGCRLRNMKRRLRKGRVLHSNEADYLINGMYL